MTVIAEAMEARRESPSVAFLRWALPRMGLQWSGFRRVRRQVWRRVAQRMAALHLGDPGEYREYLESHPEEWKVFDSFCRIPISRFLRDFAVFEQLATDVLPSLATAARGRGEHRLRIWSAGCASGEEPYSLALLWRLEVCARIPGLELEVVATDVDAHLIERARDARYRASSLREVPRAWIETAFTRHGEWFEVGPEFRSLVEFRCADVRTELPDGVFDAILCRNLVCTYFDEDLGRKTLARMLSILRPGGALVVGLEERLPVGLAGVEEWARPAGIFRRTATVSDAPASSREAVACS